MSRKTCRMHQFKEVGYMREDAWTLNITYE